MLTHDDVRFVVTGRRCCAGSDPFGRTSDVKAAVELAKKNGAKIFV